MTERKTFKRRVRERMSKTGESYTTARAQVEQKRQRNTNARARLATAGSADRMPDDKVLGATGKTWDQWFAILDKWGARTKEHSEIARYLAEKHGVPSWWSQSVTVTYERARGMRLKHQQLDGSGFAISASKTVGVDVGTLFDAVVVAKQRKQWLVDGTMSLRTSQPNRSARFDWEDGSTRVLFGFEDKGPSKSMVAIQHERLPDADEAEIAKAMWKKRLAELKAFLES